MPYIGNITQDFNVSNAMLDTDSVTSIKIVDGTIEGADIAANLDLSDSQKIRFGAGNDLQIFHDGSDSFIKDAGTGSLTLNSNLIALNNAGQTENMLTATENDAVKLYFDNSKKFETMSTGVDVHGTLRADEIKLQGDNQILKIGGADDLQLYHSGQNSIINNNVGDLRLESDIIELLNHDSNEFYLRASNGGAVDLYYNGSKKLETKSTGVIVSNQSNNRILDVHHTNGDNAYIAFLDQNTTDNSIVRLGAIANEMTIFSGGSETLRLTSNRDVNIPNDSKKLQLGAGQDLQIYHDGTRSWIKNDTGGLRLSVAGGSNRVDINKGAVDEHMAKFEADGAVELYYDNSKKFETYTNGCTVTGNLNAGNVDLADNAKARFGASNDLQIYHDGTASFITNTTGGLNLNDTGGYFRVKSDDIKLEAANGEDFLECDANGAVKLYFDGGEKFVTRSGGVTVSSTLGIANVGGDLAGSGGGQDYMGIRDSSANFAFMVKTSGTNNGFVGIGETVPLAPLHIKPAANVSQLLIEQNNATDGYALFQDGPNGGHLKFMRHINGSETQKLLLRNDGGLCFGTDSATANALDDYEEGTWTPDLNANISESNVSSRYVKIGRSVTAQFYVNIPGTFGQAAGASDTSLVISGLPYAAGSNSFHTGVIDVGNGGAAGAYLRVSGGASTLSVLVGSGSVGTARTHLRGNTIGAGDYVIGSITYQTA